ncbi:thiamine phosphate synthase [Flavobacterium sp. ZS1P14]|uniref:thiamine phosphate synthase n=1 Tax=Flavobacterium sp. ZS1P14 TaxID=3401729 RepID=UPI003AAE9EBB
MIVISNPTVAKNEIKIIHTLFDQGLMSFHIRKFHFSEDQMKSYLSAIGLEYNNRLVLHSHHQLAEESGITRIHLTEKTRIETSEETLRKWKERAFKLSTSIHSMTDFEQLSHAFDYAFFGPVFESISKPNYVSNLDFKSALEKRKNNNTALIALGGITPNNVKIALQYGFDDVALLGTMWNSNNPIENFILCQQIVHLH